MTFKLGGKTAAELHLLLLKDSQLPMTGQMESQLVRLPGRYGAYDFGSLTREKVFELTCAIDARSSYDLQKKARELAAHLLDGKGRPKTLDLVFDMEPDKVYRVRLSNQVPLKRILSFGSFTLNLTAVDPFASLLDYADEVGGLDSDVILDSDYRPEDSYTFSFTGPQTVEVNNFGSLDIGPVTEIVGSFSTLVITANGQTFRYNEAHSNGTLLIDHERYTAIKGETNKLAVTSGSFLLLQPGVNQVSVSGNDLNCEIRFKFKPKFI
ncbi:distal tail protein Dit [Ammoniphilus sp. YIM 78166]|uniref:distal tail protein Dit n=1 Tax=Ammoniphilus sp. YIM 78166 TaxID=1644106 RepID=UPI00106F7A04|nr:distal tail protein Dit [Ammoniphilus sp. YIM 78166]